MISDVSLTNFFKGVFCCGPASVNAVRNGEVYLPYDTSFVFAEVNGDRVYWEEDDDGAMKCAYVDKYSIGKCISTKAAGVGARDDVTSNYKYPEGLSVLTASCPLCHPRRRSWGMCA